MRWGDKEKPAFKSMELTSWFMSRFKCKIRGGAGNQEVAKIVGKNGSLDVGEGFSVWLGASRNTE